MSNNKSVKSYLWCLHCARTYEDGQFRNSSIVLNEKDYKFFRKKDISKDDLNNTIATLKICPYDGCDGDIEGDGFGWETIREHHPEYPVVPVEGIEYPL